MDTQGKFLPGDLVLTKTGEGRIVTSVDDHTVIKTVGSTGKWSFYQARELELVHRPSRDHEEPVVADEPYPELPQVHHHYYHYHYPYPVVSEPSTWITYPSWSTYPVSLGVGDSMTLRANDLGPIGPNTSLQVQIVRVTSGPDVELRWRMVSREFITG